MWHKELVETPLMHAKIMPKFCGKLCVLLTYMYVFFTERDIIGLTESSQLVYFGAKADLDDNLVLSRALLNRSEAHSIIVMVCGCTQIRT